MKINKESIKRFSTDKYSMNDYLHVKEYFGEERHDGELRDHLKDDWNKTGSLDESTGLSHLLDRLHHKINLSAASETGFWKKFYLNFSKVAAILLIPALITIAVFSYKIYLESEVADAWTEIHSPDGGRINFQLPDGTNGWLNSGSSIKYPTHFNSERKVEVSGEVWFDVIHKENRDFIVNTPTFDIKVLGTQFNVISYDHEGLTEVILEKGKVQVFDKNAVLRSTLKPNERLIYTKSTGTFSKKAFDAKAYNSWKDGLLIFKDAPATEIARRVGRKYNADIIFHGEALDSSVFRATFQDESLDEICKLLSGVVPIKYKIHKRERQANNTFTKSKVEIWLK